MPAELLQKALSDVVKVTYNCLSVDGDQSTNDTCLLMASGAAGNPEVAADSAEYTVFRNALYCVMMNLTRMLAYDGEGADQAAGVQGLRGKGSGHCHCQWQRAWYARLC